MTNESLYQPENKRGPNRHFTSAGRVYNNAQIEKIRNGDKAAEDEFRVFLTPLALELCRERARKVLPHKVNDEEFIHYIAMEALDAVFESLKDKSTTSKGWAGFSLRLHQGISSKLRSQHFHEKRYPGVDAVLDEEHPKHPHVAPQTDFIDQEEKAFLAKILKKDEFIAALKEAGSKTPERDLDIVLKRAAGYTDEELATGYGLTRQGINAVLVNSRKRLKSHLHLLPDIVTEFAIDQQPLEEAAAINAQRAFNNEYRHMLERDCQKWAEAAKEKARRSKEQAQFINDFLQQKKIIFYIFKRLDWDERHKFYALIDADGAGFSSPASAGSSKLKELQDTVRTDFELVVPALDTAFVQRVKEAMTKFREGEYYKYFPVFKEYHIAEFSDAIDKLQALHKQWIDMGSPQFTHTPRIS